MRVTPLLILAYNRPDKVTLLIDRLRPLAPQRIMIAVDGPREADSADFARVQAVRDAINAIDWTTDIQTRFRPANLGLRASVVDAVSWAVDQSGESIVVEDDVVPGKDFLPYMTRMLDQYRDDHRVAHISGYNIVPQQVMSEKEQSSRLTIYPESIAWATWARAWSGYDDSLEWGGNAGTAELAAITGATWSALRWKQHFADAAADRISTWAYRWIASMWSRGALTLSPNHNLVTYGGHDGGTNSQRRANWVELPLFDGPAQQLIDTHAVRDAGADAWMSKTVFGGSPRGVISGAAISVALELRKLRRRLRTAPH